MANPIPRNIYQRIVEKLQQAEEFAVTLIAQDGKITTARWNEEQKAETE